MARPFDNRMVARHPLRNIPCPNTPEKKRISISGSVLAVSPLRRPRIDRRHSYSGNFHSLSAPAPTPTTETDFGAEGDDQLCNANSAPNNYRCFTEMILIFINPKNYVTVVECNQCILCVYIAGCVYIFSTMEFQTFCIILCLNFRAISRAQIERGCRRLAGLDSRVLCKSEIA